MESSFLRAVEFAKFVPDDQRLGLYKQAIQLPLTEEDKASLLAHDDLYQWRFWDDLAILAYYQNDPETARLAYKTILEHDRFPTTHADRIYRNAQYYCHPLDDVSTKAFLHHLAKQKKSISSNTIHFIYLGGEMAFGLHHYLALKTATHHMPDMSIILWNDAEPEEGKQRWWKLAMRLPNVRIITTYPPTYANATKLNTKQHISDVMRIHILYTFGGIYLDLDMCTMMDWRAKSNASSNFMLCRETIQKVSNAVMWAKTSGHPMCKEWIVRYDTTYGTHEDHSATCSVRVPHEIAPKYIDVEVVPTIRFFPFDDHETQFFTRGATQYDLSECWGIHLRDTEQKRDNLQTSSIQSFLSDGSQFSRTFGSYLTWEAQEERDVALHTKLDRILELLSGNSQPQERKESVPIPIMTTQQATTGTFQPAMESDLLSQLQGLVNLTFGK